MEKVTRSLINAGHEVILIARNRKKRACYEEIDGLKIFRLPDVGLGSDRLNDVLSFPAFFNPVWIRSVWRVAKEHRPDIMLVRDLPLSLTAIDVAKRLGIPVIIDMAEAYPEMLRTVWRYEKFRISNVLVRNPWIARGVEKLACDWADHIWVVCEEAASRLIRLGVSETKITMVGNTPVLQEIEGESDSAPRVVGREHLNITFLGALDRSRDLSVAVESMKILSNSPHRFTLTIVGSGTDESRLRGAVQRMNLTGTVELKGWMGNRFAQEFLRNESDIGLVQVPSHGLSQVTLPNKLFDYMNAGLPVAASDVPPIRRIVEEEKCGLCFRADNPKSLSEALLRLRDDTLRKEMGTNGRRAVRERYNWRHDEKRLLNSIEAVAQGVVRRRPLLDS